MNFKETSFICISAIILLHIISPDSLKGQTRSEAHDDTANPGAPVSTNGAFIPNLKERKLMSSTDRLRWLEQNGEVPEDADQTDWKLASKTTWWGKPLDANTFWKGKVLWLNRDALSAAGRRGRGYPPMPYSDPTIPQYKDSTEVHAGDSGFDAGSGVQLHYTSYERAFWDKFGKTHPKPPEDISAQQTIAIMQAVPHSPSGQSNENNTELAKTLRTPPAILGYPEEAFSADALFWTYVLQQRAEYAEYTNSSAPSAQLQASILLGRLRVDPVYITQPLSRDQIAAANSWKIAYLQRLQRQNTDQSYINAYLKAWNLPASALAGSIKK